MEQQDPRDLRMMQLEQELAKLRNDLFDSQVLSSVLQQRLTERDKEATTVSVTASKLNMEIMNLRSHVSSLTGQLNDHLNKENTNGGQASTGGRDGASGERREGDATDVAADAGNVDRRPEGDEG